MGHPWGKSRTLKWKISPFWQNQEQISDMHVIKLCFVRMISFCRGKEKGIANFFLRHLLVGFLLFPQYKAIYILHSDTVFCLTRYNFNLLQFLEDRYACSLSTNTDFLSYPEHDAGGCNIVHTSQRMLYQVRCEGTHISLPVRGWWIQGRRSALL